MDMPRSRRRTASILLIAAILICCGVSAALSIRSGHTARGASTFFAGITFALLLGARLLRKDRS